jgi:hypothetical protein
LKVPALNILFPVGTILAERLLFIPSVGFCILIGEFLTGKCTHAQASLSYRFILKSCPYLLQLIVIDSGVALLVVCHHFSIE